MEYIKKYILISENDVFVLGRSDENQNKLKERIEEFIYFIDGFGKIQFMCK